MASGIYKKILIATSNRGKAVEIASLLRGCALEFARLDEFPGLDEPVEDADTFTANALIKSRHYSALTGIPTVSDDSGLMVDALDGAPGVHSARLVDPGEPDSARNAKLLAMMRSLTRPGERTARFVCAACFIDSARNIEIVEEGILNGRIAFEPEGNEGFGFDPLFIPDGNDRSVASLGLEIKNEISHRRKAFEKLARRIGAVNA